MLTRRSYRIMTFLGLAAGAYGLYVAYKATTSASK